jgi:alkaline phosphatase
MALVASSALAQAEQPKVKNVIVLISDGCSSEQYTLARWFKGEPLAVDEIRAGLVKTYIANSVVADSAPAASAYATGVRTSDKFISVGPKAPTLSVVAEPAKDLQCRPVATMLEGARLLGKATGVVVTCRLSHATPAAYLSHTPARSQEEEIAEQEVYQNADVVLGGGEEYLLPAAAGGKRRDQEDLVAVLREHGYQLARTSAELEAITSGRLFGIFAKGHMAPEIDRPQVASDEPTLEQMTRKAISLLSQDRDGFFLMVEGSQVDWACHANDPAQMLSDLVMFDRAVGAALEFAKKDGNTLVLALSDHNTGGMAIGNLASNKGYSQMTVESLLAPLKKMKASAPRLWKLLGDQKTPDNVKAVVKEHWGMEITDADAQQLLTAAGKNDESAHNAFGELLCPKYTYVGWTTHGHCGGDVPLGAFGPGRPTGVVDGPQIGAITAAGLGLDLDRLNQRLFVDAAKAFEDGQVTLDKTDPANPVIKVQVAGKTAALPVNKNLLVMGDQKIELEGVSLYISATGKMFVPQQAIQLIRGASDPLPAIDKESPEK